MTQSTLRSPLRFVNPPALYDPSPNGYSHIATVEGAISLAYISGQGGEKQDGTLSPCFDEQVKQGFRNLKSALAAIAAEARDIAKLTVLIVDHDESRLAVFSNELACSLGSDIKPACTLIPVSRLALDGMLFEIEAIVTLPRFPSG